MAMKTWQKTALALSAISVFAGLGYVGYHFLYKLPKEKRDAEKQGDKKEVENMDLGRSNPVESKTVQAGVGKSEREADAYSKDITKVSTTVQAGQGKSRS